MAKATTDTPAPRKGGMKTWLITGVVGLLAVGVGAALPVFLLGHSGAKEKTDADAKAHKEPRLVPFGDVIVNLSEGRLTRYLRVKILLSVDEANEKQVTELVNKKKAVLKNWLIGYLSDRSLEDVTGASGQNRLRREIRDQFNLLMFHDGSEKITDILFEEFVVQ